MQEIDNKAADKKKDFPKIKTKISSVVAAVCVTVVLSAAAAAFFINRAGSGDDEQIKVYYESQSFVTEFSTESRRVSATDQSAGYSCTSRKTITSKTSSAKASVKESAASKVEIVYSFPADINSVTAEQLIQIDGIGEVTAQKIIGFRSGVGIICNMDQLLEIDGIGEATLNKLKEYLYVSDWDYAELYQPEEQTTESPEPEEPEQTEIGTVTETPQTDTETTTTATKAVLQMKTVNINTASAQELAEALLIKTELAEAIVELRTNIQYFVNDLELLYVDGFSEKMLVERRPFITL